MECRSCRLRTTLCATLCSRASCRFISYSLKHRDCSRFAACDVDRLQTSVDGFCWVMGPKRGPK